MCGGARPPHAQPAKDVSRVVFGCLFLHVTEDPFALLDLAWASGMTTFDCAAIYGAGECERILGGWLTARGLHEEAVVITKGGCGDQSTLWAPQLGEASLEAEVARSRERLGVKTIDIYMLHRDDPAVSVAAIAGLMKRLIDRGLVRDWAVSNWDVARLRSILQHCAENGVPPPVMNSVQGSLAEPRREVWPGTTYLTAADKEWYAASGLPVLAWECLGKGFLSGTWDLDEMAALARAPSPQAPPVYDAAWRRQRLAAAYITPDNLARQRRLVELAVRLHRTPSALALAYLLHQPFPCHVTVGTTQRAHLLEALDCLRIRLTCDECHWLRCGSGACEAPVAPRRV